MQSQSKAYILIEAEAAQLSAVLAALHVLNGIASAEAVSGPYDVVAVLETAASDDIAGFVMDHIHAIPGINRTVTCITL